MIKRYGWILLIAVNIMMIAIMSYTGKPLKTSATPHGIIDLELAGDSTAVQNIYNFWDNDLSQPETIQAARINTYCDFVFLLGYCSLFYFLSKKVSTYYPARSLWAKIGRIGLTVTLLIGFFDILENIGMLISLSGNITDGTALFTAMSSGVKWIMVILMVGFLLLAGIGILTRKTDRV